MPADLAAARRRAHRHQHRDLVEHDRRVLDEHAVGMFAIQVERHDLGAALPQRVAVGGVLLKRELCVDRLMADVCSLASLEVGRRHVRDRHQPARGSRRHGPDGPFSVCRSTSRSTGVPTNRFSGKRRYLSIWS